MKITEKIFDATTGQETILERNATPEEIASMERKKSEIAAELAELANRQAARKTILDKLGLTEEEAKTLLG